MSLAENLNEVIKKAVEEAVNAELERRIPLLAKELDVDEKKIRKVFGTKVVIEEKETQKKFRGAQPIDSFDDGNLRIIVDYDSSHFLCIGRRASMSIKETILKPLGAQFRKNYDFGPGWLLLRSNLQDLLKKLDKMKGKTAVKYIEMTREEAEEFNSKLENDDSDLEAKLMKTEKKSKKGSKRNDSDDEKEDKKKTTKPKKKNDNDEEEDKKGKSKKDKSPVDSDDESEKDTKTEATKAKLAAIKKKMRGESEL